MYTSQVKKIVQGQFELFQKMYNPFLEEFAAQDLLRVFSVDQGVNLVQVRPNSKALCKTDSSSSQFTVLRVFSLLFTTLAGCPLDILRDMYVLLHA